MPVQSKDILIHTGLELLASALPVTSADSLVRSLTTAWSQACRCSSLFVSLISHGKATGLLLENGKPTWISGTCKENWTATTAAEWIPDDCQGLLSSMTVVPFSVERKPEPSPVAMGGVFILDAGIELQKLKSLAELSGQLIEQLRLTSSTEQELRDRKLEAMAEFAAGAGHEINNPVATIVGRASLLLRGEENPDRRRALETIGAQAYRIRDMIGDAMTFARPPEPQYREICPATLVEETLASLDERRQLQNTKVSHDLARTPRFSADPEQFRVVAACLIRNSLEALQSGGEILIRLFAEPDDQIVLAVSDDGPGLDRIEREHLFDPFFSGRQAGRGLGFGLSRCWQILRQHGGSIAVEDCESGFSIRTTWPVHR